MAAATLQTKKTVNKGKIKRTLKNVLCRPDPIFWPQVTEDQMNLVAAAMSEYKADIPEFNKPHWKDVKQLPKDKRPKPPKIKKNAGLFFGISECSDAVNDNSCAAIMIESTVNPRLIVQPIIESCNRGGVPVICVSDLRTMTTKNFGIPTSCLGIKQDSLPNLRCQVVEIASSFKPPPVANSDDVKNSGSIDVSKVEMAVDGIPSAIQCRYLYRTNKKSRVFNPSEESMHNNITNFSGQDFIGFGKKESLKTQSLDRKSYMEMVLKKITNNPNRTKVK